MLYTFLAAVALASDTYDVVVYDASSGGVIAAVAAARHGASEYAVTRTFRARYPCVV